MDPIVELLLTIPVVVTVEFEPVVLLFAIAIVLGFVTVVAKVPGGTDEVPLRLTQPPEQTLVSAHALAVGKGAITTF
jgi:hypothetical protein